MAAAEYLKAYAIDCVFTAFLFCFIGCFNGCGRTTFVMLQGTICAFDVRMPVTWLMSKQIPVSLFHIGFAIPASTIVQITLCGIYFGVMLRKEKVNSRIVIDKCVYWKCKNNSDAAIILMIGDDPEDYMARSGVRWLHSLGVNVMSMSPGKKDYGHHNYPLERIENVIMWLKKNGIRKIGIVGASTTGTLALTAAAYLQGFIRGKKDGCKEWPVEGESLFSYKGEPLSFMPFVYKHPEYWRVIAAESKKTGDMVNSWKLFDDSEKAHPHKPEEMIPVEKIKGKLLLIGASRDCKVEIATYEHGTHLVFPESMLKTMLPVFSGMFVKMAFKAAKEYPKECKETRLDIDRRVRKAIQEWM